MNDEVDVNVDVVSTQTVLSILQSLGQQGVLSLLEDLWAESAASSSSFDRIGRAKYSVDAYPNFPLDDLVTTGAAM
jgi:hypothetical protein